MQVKWNRYALQQLDTYLAGCLRQFNERVSTEFYNRVMEYAEMLGSHPHMGKEEPLLEGYLLEFRSLVVHKHFKLIYYVRGGTVHIADIWDIRREPETLVRRIKSKKA